MTRVDGVVLLKGTLRLILQLLELFLKNDGLAIHFGIDALDRFQTGLDPVRRNHIQQPLRKTAVHRRPSKTDAIHALEVSCTQIACVGSTFSPVANAHLLATSAAAQ